MRMAKIICGSRAGFDFLGGSNIGPCDEFIDNWVKFAI